MNPIIEAIDCSLDTDKAFAPVVEQWLRTSDKTLAENFSMSSNGSGYSDLAVHLLELYPEHPDLLEVFRFFVELSNVAKTGAQEKHVPLKGLFEWYLKDGDKREPSVELLDLIENYHRDLKAFALYFFQERSWKRYGFEASKSPVPERPFNSTFANLIWSEIDEDFAKLPDIFADQEDLLVMVAKYRPELVKIWAPLSLKLSGWGSSKAWFLVIDTSTDFDNECLDFCSKRKGRNAGSAFNTLYYLNEARDGKYLDLTIEYARLPEAIQSSEALLLGLKHFPDEVLSLYTRAVSLFGGSQFVPEFSADGYPQLFALALEKWDSQGADFMRSLARKLSVSRFSELFNPEVVRLSKVTYPVLREVMFERCQEVKGGHLVELWEVALSNHPLAFADDLVDLLSAGVKRLRGLAAQTLSSIHGAEFIPAASELLAHKKADVRHGAAELLGKLGVAAVVPLKAAHAIEKSQKVQAAIEEALSIVGGESNLIGEVSSDQILKQIETDKRIKLPSAPWFDISKIALVQKDGTAFPEKALVFLIQKQAKHKSLEAAPGVLPLLDLVDREKNADAALALVEQFLDSDQQAKDRWALTLGGLLGDNRIITALTPQIQPWCEAARHKLAEYAAQAIALLGTDEALMILDTLANRYRSKFKNIGKACREAFTKAAEIRDVSEDELGDLVVPDLGFNAECHKEFDDGKVIAVLQPDFKIHWHNPETEKETKSPPSSLSEEGRTELKALRKMLREAVKSQTTRFEQMLVRQRRWPVARWQELFEEHPLLQSYASSLVWGIYDVKGELLRTFRRYPNGILAHGSGEMEDLEEKDAMIGIVHPLELDDKSFSVWRDHLGRFKVKSPFAQIDRAVELVKEGHGNRREIGITDQVSMSYGTFNGRTNRLGWIRGSVIEGGCVVSYYKPFHGAGVEAILMMGECWAGMESMEEVSIGKALFAKIDSIERGCYLYDDLEPNDARVLTFGEVPSIVYSETIADLKAITAGQGSN